MPTLAVRRIRAEIDTVVVGYQCNRCERQTRWDEGSASYEGGDFHPFSASGGYSTKYPGDTDRIDFILCSDCLKAVCDEFKIPVDYTAGMGGHCEPLAVTLEANLEPATINWGWLVEGDVEDIEHKDHPDDFYDHDWPQCHPSCKLVYRHYKGKYYEVLRHVLHFETGEPYVIYSPLYGEPRLWARPLSSWNEIVEGIHHSPQGRFVDPRRFEPVKLTSML